MHFWNNALKRLGFRQKSKRYWQCNKGYGLCHHSHISLFVGNVQNEKSPAATYYEVMEFHITFEAVGHNLHFYYHEQTPEIWSPGGHTSTPEVERLGLNVAELQERAHDIARALVSRFRGELRIEVDDD